MSMLRNECLYLYNTSYIHHLFWLNDAVSMSWRHDVELNPLQTQFFLPSHPKERDPCFQTPEEHSFHMRHPPSTTGCYLLGGWGANVFWVWG